MDKNDFEFIDTKLVKVFLDESLFREKMAFSLRVEYSIQASDNVSEESVIKVIGELTASNFDEDTATNILMESYFETERKIEEEDLEELNDFLRIPVLNEISLLLAQLTGKALKVPIIMPLDTEEE